MPLYHFHFFDAHGRSSLHEVWLSGQKDARSEALRAAGEKLKDVGLRGDPGENWSIEVTNDGNVVLFRMDFVMSEAPALNWDDPQTRPPAFEDRPRILRRG